MVELKNSEKGKRCFIIGTGSSIKEQDLTLLKDEIVIGISGLYHHRDLQIFKPKYYLNPPIFKWHSYCFDEEYYIKHLSNMDNTLDNKTIMFFDKTDAEKIKEYNLFKNKKIYYTNSINYDIEDENEENFDFNNLPIAYISEYSIRLAIYLGFEEIFLLGFDHDWFNGMFVYFTNNYLKHADKDRINNMNVHLQVDSQYQMLRHARLFETYKKLFNIKQNIYNANTNINTYLDTFPKVSFEELFKNNYKEYIKIEKEHFKIINNISVSKRYIFSLDFNRFFDHIMLLKKKEDSYIIYGNGKISKTIQLLMPNKIVGYVDIADRDYHPSTLKIKKFDKIIISVLGREREIINYLVKDINIPRNKIIILATSVLPL